VVEIVEIAAKLSLLLGELGRTRLTQPSQIGIKLDCQTLACILLAKAYPALVVGIQKNSPPIGNLHIFLSPERLRRTIPWNSVMYDGQW
jgi:hypothetical protein